MIPKFVNPKINEIGNIKIFPIIPINIVAGIFDNTSFIGSLIKSAKKFPINIIIIQLKTDNKINFSLP